MKRINALIQLRHSNRVSAMVLACAVASLIGCTVGCQETSNIAGSDAGTAEESDRLAITDVASPAPTAEERDERSEGKTRYQEVAPVEIPEELNFFSLPEATARAPEKKTPDATDDPDVRLLGFLCVSPEETTDCVALLKIGDKLFQASAGQTVAGVKLLSIDRRSVTLQRRRDRWTLELFDQSARHSSNTPSVFHDQPSKRSRHTNQAIPRTGVPAAVSMPRDPRIPSEPGLPPEPDLPPLPQPFDPESTETLFPEVELPPIDTPPGFEL
ncbi:MAG: hypothetical protein R3C05_14270 [Pirellulaceae bacterium]